MTTLTPHAHATADSDQSYVPSLPDAAFAVLGSLADDDRQDAMRKLAIETVRRALALQPNFDLDREVTFPYLGTVNLRALLDHSHNLARSA